MNDVLNLHTFSSTNMFRQCVSAIASGLVDVAGGEDIAGVPAVAGQLTA